MACKALQIPALLFLLLVGNLQTFAQDQRPELRARRTSIPPHIDGEVTESVWQHAAVAHTFWQREPNEGAPATERTEVRVLYDNEALYVAFICYDSEPDKIIRRLARRDRETDADKVTVFIDSYLDRKTAFAFRINAAGVKRDILISNDGDTWDGNWDAIWYARVHMQPDGWSAEFKIPYQALRFSHKPVQTWGINFSRYIARKQEIDQWALIRRSEPGFVSRFGLLKGLKDLRPPRPLLLMPYTAGIITRWPGNQMPAYLHTSSIEGRVGLDAQYGITPSTMLNLTINPDFGQVEADEVVLNLTAFETFFPEKRPFFLEGTSIFQTVGAAGGDALSTYLFYSRRIGRRPDGYYRWLDTLDIRTWRIVKNPATTPILGALKLSGKEGKWGLGLLNATTGRTYKILRNEQTGKEFRLQAASRTNYTVGRLQYALPGPGSYVGAIGTAMLQEGNRQSTAGGVDWRIASADYLLYTEGLAAFSYRKVEDFRQIGYQLQARLSSLKYEHWKGTVGFSYFSPDFNVNDVGFNVLQNIFVVYGWSQLAEEHPYGPSQRMNLYLNAWRTYQVEPWLATLWGGNVSSHITWKNFWNSGFGINMEGGIDPFESRGAGPYDRPVQTSIWCYVRTHPARSIVLSLNPSSQRATNGMYAYGLDLSATFKPGTQTQISLSPGFQVTRKEWGWVTNTREASIFGERAIDQVSITVRAMHTFNPDLSIQWYSQYFWARGYYSRFFRLRKDGHLEALSFPYDRSNYGDPDFNRSALNINFVLRYEYLPGSTLFLVWTHGRDVFLHDSTLNMINSVRKTLSSPALNAFLVKVTYAFNL